MKVLFDRNGYEESFDVESFVTVIIDLGDDKKRHIRITDKEVIQEIYHDKRGLIDAGSWFHDHMLSEG